MLILISWLHKKPADLDLHCFQQSVKSFEKKLYSQCAYKIYYYSKTCIKWPLSKLPKLVFKTIYCLMQVKSIAECSKGSILQYFRPSLNYQLLSKFLFCLFLSGRFTQVLLYTLNVNDQLCSVSIDNLFFKTFIFFSSLWLYASSKGSEPLLLAYAVNSLLLLTQNPLD